MDRIQLELFEKKNMFTYEYVGIHEEREVNNLFSFKIRKIFTQ